MTEFVEKSGNMKKAYVLIFFTILVFVSANAQKDIVGYLKLTDLRDPFIKSYLKPMAKMTSSNMNTGWYNSAKVKRFMAFDVGFAMIESSVPSVNRGFYVNQIDNFSDYYTLYSGPSVTPNVAGSSENLPVLSNLVTGDITALPNGNNLQKLKMPVLKFHLGLPYNTEMALKVMPKIKNGDFGKTSQYGIALMHNIKEYFPGLKKVPAMSMSVSVGGLWFNNDIDLEYESMTSSNQSLNGRSSAYSGLLLIGWDVRIISFYAAGGYSLTQVKYDFNGYYYVGNIDDTNEEKDPVSIKYDMNQFVFYAGVLAKLGFIDVFAEYNPTEYNSFSFGIGYSFR